MIAVDVHDRTKIVRLSRVGLLRKRLDNNENRESTFPVFVA